MSRERLAEIVRRGTRFLCTCHVRPDADALGSALGFSAVLRALGKETVVYSAGGVPESVRFLEGADEVREDVSAETFDGTFVMDAAAAELVPPLPKGSGPVVVVDHHAAADSFGDVIVREVDAVATGELILRLAEELGLGEIPRAAAQPLYAAIVADTGGFRYAGTNPTTHKIAARLLELGVDPWGVASNLFERWTCARMKLLGEVLQAMTISAEDRVALVTVDRSMLQRTGATDEMIEGMVNYGRMLEGVEVAALVWSPKGTRECKVSLRSAGRVDVAKVAIELGGGGHRSAAGATIRSEIESAAARVRAVCERAVRALGSERVEAST